MRVCPVDGCGRSMGFLSVMCDEHVRYLTAEERRGVIDAWNRGSYGPEHLAALEHAAALVKERAAKET